MTINPVFRREMKVSARNIRLPLIIASFNFILAVFALFSMAETIGEARLSAQINYATFLVIFRYVAIIEFVLVLFLMPAITSDSISGEREHRTLDLMLTTRMTPAQIVMGKLETALSTIAIVIISSLPVFALVLSYGGVSVANMLLLLVAFLVTALFTASIGIWASSISSRSAMATALAYGVLLIFVGGTVGILILTKTFSGTAGAMIYVLLANPVATFYAIISLVTGARNPFGSIAGLLGVSSSMLTPMTAFLLGICIEAAISAALILLAIRSVSRGGASGGR